MFLQIISPIVIFLVTPLLWISIVLMALHLFLFLYIKKEINSNLESIRSVNLAIILSITLFNFIIINFWIPSIMSVLWVISVLLIIGLFSIYVTYLNTQEAIKLLMFTEKLCNIGYIFLFITAAVCITVIASFIVFIIMEFIY